MKRCEHCRQELEWRYKDGWRVMACPGWFTGSCEGQPQGVIFPAGTIRLREDEEHAQAYARWLNACLRAVWPLETKP